MICPSTTDSIYPMPTTPPDSRTKTVLFCPNCGHESDITGDWHVYTEHARQLYDCPICTTTITERLRRSPLPVSDD